MLESRSRRSTKQQAIGVSRAQSQRGGEDIQDFLERELPPGKTKQATYLTDVLREAGARYDRYIANREAWLDYAPRKRRFERTSKLAEELAVNMCKLDILSRDDLASRVDPKQIEALVGSLLLLSKQATDLANDIQKNGRPRDLAEERWILEVADIYENFFVGPHVSGGQVQGR
jgi:hypothetical protein